MADFTPYKKEMSYRMALAYCRGVHGHDDLCEECLGHLMRTVGRLDNCRFKEEGRPCPSCSECCFHGKDYDMMIAIVSYEGKHPEMAKEVGSDRAMRGMDSLDDANKRYDARFDRTKVAIKETFLKLLEENRYGDISISAICKDAGISRDTFYYHYKTKLDLVDDCVFDFTYRTDYMPSQAKYSRWDHEPVGEPMCILLRGSKSYQNLFFDEEVGDHCVDLMIACSSPHLIHSIIARTDAGAEKIVTVNRMAILGCINMIRANLNKSDEEWLKIKESIDRYNQGGLNMLNFD